MKQYQKPEIEQNNFLSDEHIASGGVLSYFTSSGSSSSADIDGGNTNFLLDWLGL